jgi:chromosome segregation ATPase
MSAVDTLVKMKKEIEEARNKKARLEGERDSIESQLKDMGLDTIEDAENELDRLEEEETQLSNELEEKVEELRNSYDWKTV